MTQHIDVLYIVPLAHFTAVKNQLNDLRTKLGGMRVSMQVTTPPEADTVRHILISGSLGLRGGKRLMDRLLAGEVVKHNGKVLWDEDVDTFYGVSILAEIDVPDTYISISRRDQSYTVHGSFDQREEAANYLSIAYGEPSPISMCTNFQGTNCVGGPERGYLDQRESWGRNFWLDPLHCRITVRGGGPARGIVQHCTNIARNSWHPPPRPVNGGTLFCPACFEEASDPVRIGCKHVYCHELFHCFSR
jgi:hypothetical protein